MINRILIVRIAVIVLAFAGMAIVSCSALQVPTSLAPALATWAAKKAVRLSQCLADGKRGTDLVSCLGEYVDDRGTYACERVRANLEGD